MKQTLEFTIDILEIIPDNSICYIQAPSLDDVDFLKVMTESKYDWAQQIILSKENKLKLKKVLLENEIEEQFQNVTIEKESKKIFESFDGMEIGELSKSVIVPNWFFAKYIETEYCIISEDW